MKFFNKTKIKNKTDSNHHRHHSRNWKTKELQIKCSEISCSFQRWKNYTSCSKNASAKMFVCCFFQLNWKEKRYKDSVDAETLAIIVRMNVQIPKETSHWTTNKFYKYRTILQTKTKALRVKITRSSRWIVAMLA